MEFKPHIQIKRFFLFTFTIRNDDDVVVGDDDGDDDDDGNDSTLTTIARTTRPNRMIAFLLLASNIYKIIV